VVVPVVEKIAKAVIETLKKPADQKLDLVLREDEESSITGSISSNRSPKNKHHSKKSKIVRK
jgi:hypothetical protein